MKNSELSFKNYLYVALQFLLFLFWIFDFEILKFMRLGWLQPVFLIFSGIGFILIVISLLHLNTNLSPFPKPKKNAKLVTTGVFKYIRHPIYSGILFFLFFLSLYFSSFYKLGIVLLLMILFWFKSSYEEQQLSLKYPGYSNYRQRTGRFFPKFKLSKTY